LEKFSKNFLSIGCSHPVVGKIFKKSSKHFSNHLTLRIEPFRKNEKKKFFRKIFQNFSKIFSQHIFEPFLAKIMPN